MEKQPTYADRVTVVALRAYTTKTSQEIAKIVDLSISTVNRIYARAIERGFDPVHTKITDEYVEDNPRAGRSPRQDPKTINNKMSKLGKDRYIILSSLDYPQEGRSSRNEAYEEAWTDEEDAS
ncbi:hypothetical protein F1880_003459 [Penicillium rolfsii]|nr:hypothetical protein F1880_003459 [Penicillium rolfsii]